MDPKINQGFCLAWLSWIAKRRHIIRLCNIGFQSFFKVRRATIQRLRSAYQKTENAVSEITVYPFWHFQPTPFQTQPSPAPASGIKQNPFRNTISYPKMQMYNVDCKETNTKEPPNCPPKTLNSINQELSTTESKTAPKKCPKWHLLNVPKLVPNLGVQNHHLRCSEKPQFGISEIKNFQKSGTQKWPQF